MNQFGTHLIIEVTMGGRLSIQTTADACMSKAVAEQQAEAEVFGAYTAIEACASASISQGDSSETNSKASSCALKVEGGDIQKCLAGTCGRHMCDHDAWVNSMGQQFQWLSPLSFQLAPLPELLREDSLFQKSNFTDVLEQKIIARWEAAAQAATNVQLDDSTCESAVVGTVDSG